MAVAVLLSGGVDSSVALRLLKQQDNHDLRAFYLKIWLEDDLAFLGECPWEADLGFARAVCEQVGVPLEIVSLQSEYREAVVEHALGELRAGRTPSPDILCNQRIKFGIFLDRIGPEYEKVASGHYAAIQSGAGAFRLRRGVDPVKDQTYFLSNLGQHQLARACFPIGHLHKIEVRDLAARFDLPTRDRPDSQGICFLGKISYRDFVRFHLGEQPGDIVEYETGKKLGRHLGPWFHTIGQRHGLGLSGGPWYVVAKDMERNIVHVSHGERHERWSRSRFTVGRINWIGGKPDSPGLQVKIRHGPDTPACTVEFVGSGRVHVALVRPDAGVAPGQHAVFYDGETCLGGGVIE